MKLPIDIVPSISGLRFRWSQTVDSLAGIRTVDCEGLLTLSAEKAVADLIDLAKHLTAENGRLREQLASKTSKD